MRIVYQFPALFAMTELLLPNLMAAQPTYCHPSLPKLVGVMKLARWQRNCMDQQEYRTEVQLAAELLEVLLVQPSVELIPE